ncbi:hypothetical protein QBC41DRAFT_109927 [Cercophora samala]|uniref:Chromo domain-containing protein n=1 Tax=Cercophora samala TaxID=330535 RepID=A0AA39ZEB5_9PEZI|nr:hypothetical protein QBC41DRAFT_109927 [Cercophora samala]
MKRQCLERNSVSRLTLAPVSWSPLRLREDEALLVDWVDKGEKVVLLNKEFDDSNSHTCEGVMSTKTGYSVRQEDDTTYDRGGLRSPSFAPQSPCYVPRSPCYVPRSPCYVLKSPSYSPQSPAYVPGSPSYVLRSPSYRPRSPNYAPRSPRYDQRRPSYTPNNLPVAEWSPVYVPESSIYTRESPLYVQQTPIYAPRSPSFTPNTPLATPHSTPGQTDASFSTLRVSPSPSSSYVEQDYDTAEILVAESIIDHVVFHDGSRHYLVKWEGSGELTWESERWIRESVLCDEYERGLKDYE